MATKTTTAPKRVVPVITTVLCAVRVQVAVAADGVAVSGIVADAVGAALDASRDERSAEISADFVKKYA